MHRFKDEWLAQLAVQKFGLTSQALEKFRKSGEVWLANALSREGIASAEQIGSAVQATYRIPPADADPDAIDRSLINLITEKACRAHSMVPVAVKDTTIEVAMCNPLDLEAQQSAQFASGKRVVPLYCHPSEMDGLMDELASPGATVSRLLDRLGNQATADITCLTEAGVIASHEVTSPVVPLVNAVIADAFRLKASDIHIEQEEHATQIRFRIDGHLKRILRLPRYLGAGPMVARLKIMSNLDVADRLRPQDGRATMQIGSKGVGLRVSTLPTPLGEKVVIRILDESNSNRSIANLGLRPDLLERFQPMILRKQGMILVTGPTGSGKTTTLHAVLGTLKSEVSNLVSIEDPIEYRVQGINQIQVNEAQGLTFASILRSVLRQDPDVIMVGEIRDAETATTALQAAQTGHLVLSTLHTNDTVTTVARLVDIGVEPYKIAASLIGITAQRLVRRLCSFCSFVQPDDQVPERIAIAMRKRGLTPQLWSSAGCGSCSHTGYKGRQLLVEILSISPAVREAIGAGKDLNTLRRAAKETKSLFGLEEDILLHLSEGRTSLAEVEPYLNAADLSSDAAEPAEAMDTSWQILTRPMARLANRTVLLAESDLATREVLKSRLQLVGEFAIEEAGSAIAALNSVSNDAPDLIVLGTSLGKASGLVSMIRGELGKADVPILILAKDDPGIPDLFDGGTTEVMRVPVDVDVFEARVRALLERGNGWMDTREARHALPAPDEAVRVASVHASGLLDTPEEERFDAITRLAQQMFDVPIALVSLIDEGRQWFKSHMGLPLRETPRDQAFCAHAIRHESPFVVMDAALDARFAENPLVLRDPAIRFYAGQPIHSKDNQKIGTLCIIDTRPRSMDAKQLDMLRNLGELVEKEIAATPAAK